MSPNIQNALLLTAKQGDYAIDTLSIPKPGPGVLLVKIQAAALNPVDWKIQKYDFIKTYPAVLGTDIAGEVVELGEGVTRISVGDRVFFQGIYANETAGFQQYTLAMADTVGKIPTSLSYDDASTIPLGLTTAYIGLYQVAPDGFGLVSPLEISARRQYVEKPFVVIGGSSSVGQYVLQLAKASGFSPIITTSSLKHEAYLKYLGATHIIDRNNPLAEEVGTITNVRIEYVYDAIASGDTQQAGYDILAPYGKLAVAQARAVVQTHSDKPIIEVVASLTLPHNRAVLVKLYDKLHDLLEEGVIKPNRVEVLPGGLGGVAEGLKRMKNDQVSGIKLVAHPQDTV